MKKICGKCKVEKSLDCFQWRSDRKQYDLIKQYHTMCKECKKEYNKEYGPKHFQKNKEAIILQRKKKRHEDELTRLRGVLSSRCREAFRYKSMRKDSGIRELLGADLDAVKKHIEDQFVDGMSWENWSLDGWHIDHIIPLGSAKDEKELRVLCHYTNLQPLWAFDNLSKGDRI